MANIKNGIVNDKAWLNNTWLAPYVGYPVKFFTHKGGIQNLELDSVVFEDVAGEWISEHNGWVYTINDIVDFK